MIFKGHILSLFSIRILPFLVLLFCSKIGHSQESIEELSEELKQINYSSIDFNKNKTFIKLSEELFSFHDTLIAKETSAILWNLSEDYESKILKNLYHLWLKISLEEEKLATTKSLSIDLANLYFEDAAYDSAHYYINYADSLFNFYEEYDSWGELYLLKSAVYDAQGEFTKSIESVFQAIDKFEKGELNKKQLAFSYLQIGSSYLYLNLFEKTNKYFRLAENYFNDLNDSLGVAITRSNMALVEYEKKNYTKSIALLKGALDDIIKSNRHTSISYALQSLAENFIEINELDSASYYLDKSTQLNKEHNYKYGIGLDNLLKARLYAKKNEIDSSIFHGEKAFNLLKDDEDYFLLSKLSLLLAKQYQKKKVYDKSISYYEKSNEFNSILNEENKNIIQLIQSENANLEKTKYELKLLKEKKRLQEFDNERKQERFIRATIVASIAISLLLLSLYFLYRNRSLTKELKIQKDLISKELAMKRSLLGEIHHRVKNNLQIISSMLSIQSQYIKDDRLDHVIRECRNRIVSMSLIHESLYKRESEEKSIFSQYIKELIPQLVETYQVDESKIKLELDIEEFELSLDDSIPCGLVINEIISNSLKHAFKGKEEGLIKLSMKHEQSMIELNVSDNGIGLSDSITPQEHDSFGFLLINSLVKQLGAKLITNNNNGLSYTIRWRSHSDKLLS